MDVSLQVGGIRPDVPVERNSPGAAGSVAHRPPHAEPGYHPCRGSFNPVPVVGAAAAIRICEGARGHRPQILERCGGAFRPFEETEGSARLHRAPVHDVLGAFDRDEHPLANHPGVGIGGKRGGQAVNHLVEVEPPDLRAAPGRAGHDVVRCQVQELVAEPEVRVVRQDVVGGAGGIDSVRADRQRINRPPYPYGYYPVGLSGVGVEKGTEGSSRPFVVDDVRVAACDRGVKGPARDSDAGKHTATTEGVLLVGVAHVEGVVAVVDRSGLGERVADPHRGCS